MKIIFSLILLALSCGAAQATDSPFAYADNMAGGRIFLMGERGACPERSLRAFASERGVIKSRGCWVAGDKIAVVQYEDGTVAIYQSKDFTHVGALGAPFHGATKP